MPDRTITTCFKDVAVNFKRRSTELLESQISPSSQRLGHTKYRVRGNIDYSDLGELHSSIRMLNAHRELGRVRELDSADTYTRQGTCILMLKVLPGVK